MEEEIILNPENDLVFYEKNDQLFGGGYKLESELLKSSIKDKSKNLNLSGGNLLNSLKDLAVPVGLLYVQNKAKQNVYKYDNKDEIIDDTIFDELLNMMKPEERKQYSIKTRKNKEKKIKTRKNK
tara:strand:- start:271 stop:645 length:375 start_codon:yes stop_codon:yes gene_type:complete